MDTQPGYPVPGHLTCNPSSRRGASHVGSQSEEAVPVTHDIYKSLGNDTFYGPEEEPTAEPQEQQDQ